MFIDARCYCLPTQYSDTVAIFRIFRLSLACGSLWMNMDSYGPPILRFKGRRILAFGFPPVLS